MFTKKLYNYNPQKLDIRKGDSEVNKNKNLKSAYKILHKNNPNSIQKNMETIQIFYNFCDAKKVNILPDY